METLLNVVWVLASVLCASAGWIHFRRFSRPRHSAQVALIALALVSVLLFPVISASDDLHATLFAFEDALRRIDGVLHAPAATAFVTLATLTLLLIASLVCTGNVACYEPATTAQPGFTGLITGRAPPAV